MKLLKKYLKQSGYYAEFVKNAAQRQSVFGLGPVSLLKMCECLLQSGKIDGNLYLVCPTEESATQYLNDSRYALSDNVGVFLPASGKELYAPSCASEAEFARIKSLRQISEKNGQLVIVPLRSFCTAVAKPETIAVTSLAISKGRSFEPVKIAGALANAGYIRTTSTSMPGEFSVRGEVVDIFPRGEESPVRIFSAWDEVEKICIFDPGTQKTEKELSRIRIDISFPEGEDSFGFIDGYFKKGDYFVFDGTARLKSSLKSLVNESKALYRKAYADNPDCKKPAEILFPFENFFEQVQRCTCIEDLQDENVSVKRFEIDGPRSYFGNFTFLKEDLSGLFSGNWSVKILCSTEIQKTRLSQMLPMFPEIEYEVGRLSGGFTIPSEKHVFLTDGEIFGRRKQISKTLTRIESSPLDSFVELKEGDYVVHVNYGIGKFLKIDRVRERDYIKIQYQSDEFLYVPIEQANLIQRYIGSAGEAPKCDKLDGSSWQKKKAKARENAEKLAKSLIGLYARRQESFGYPFPKDTDWQLQFEAEFPYDETEDQLKCVDEIKSDMESPKVMDRLVCGDVGYGKTEIAFRAAFKAVLASKQVAFLAPTTILAEQHYNNFLERCKSFPVRAGILSRMVDRKQQRLTLKGIADGQIDIIFGTHRILQDDVKFADLGLLVVDEEQRFGVKDKERIKQMRTNIDCLSLSATPIPRTLYMSLLKIRDMSLLTTPPVSRRPIKTTIAEYNLDTVVDAIRRETSRQGQVFYLHNRIESLEEVTMMLRSRMPELIIEYVHGQMDSAAIEDIMRRFVYEGIQVLVSTTIIENGIDIPNVNTMIIDRADLYGVSQLYQLRGRVGRSDRQAQAYLLYPSDAILSEVAIKRLKVISENTELGSGFKVAMKDMEIRGAGNILGKEQSGQLSAVGLDMYIRLLDEEIERLKNSNETPEREVFFELDYSGFIPDSYISDPPIKFEVYRKIASINDEQGLYSLTSELCNRFGAIPEEVSNLLYIAELKIICRKLGIYHLKEFRGKVIAEFSKLNAVPPERLVNLITTTNGSCRLDARRPNLLLMNTDAISLKDKSLFILEKLQRLL